MIPAAERPCLEANNLVIRPRSSSGEDAIVRGIDLRLSSGSVFGIVGQSGSGKSLTAMALLGLLPPNLEVAPESEILLTEGGNKHSLLPMSDRDRRQMQARHCGVVFQEAGGSLNPVLTIGEQIVESLVYGGCVGDVAFLRAREALERVRLEPDLVFERFPHALSGGQQQRAMIALALARRPRFMIADEPTTALDPSIQKDILLLLRSLVDEEGMGLLLITHSFSVIDCVADQVAVMRDGLIVEQGEADGLFTRFAHPYTTALLEALPEVRQHLRDREKTAEGGREPKPSKNASAATSAGKKAAPLLEARGLKMHYPVLSGVFRRVVGWIKSVDGVDIAIERGSITALVGESGSGKTSLGLVLARLLKPQQGEILFDGTPLGKARGGELKKLRRRLQLVFQDSTTSLNPRLTPATAMIELMACHGIGASREERLERARQSFAQVQLQERFLDCYPNQLSGGQRQRAAIARALCLSPEFLICDEITASLDILVQAEILNLLLDLRARHNLSMLIITHDINLVRHISSRVLVMNAGKIVENGEVEQVCNCPRSDYTRKLLEAELRLADATVAELAARARKTALSMNTGSVAFKV